MKLAKDLLGTPAKDVVQIEHNGVRYMATEEDCRYLQELVLDGKVNHNDYKVIDTDTNGKEYVLELQSHDATFSGSFTSNTFSYNSRITLKIIAERRKREKQTNK